MSDETQLAEAIEVFFSYAHEDEGLRDELEKHLSILKRQGVIRGWHDRRIDAGREWEGEIDAHLNTAQVILLLVSADFLDSDYCWDVEVKRAMERHEAEDAFVIPVILRPVVWKSAPFGKLEALPTHAKPVTTWANQDEAFEDIARGIQVIISKLKDGVLESPDQEPVWDDSGIPIGQPWSYDFCEQFESAIAHNIQSHVQCKKALCGRLFKKALWAHPPKEGDGYYLYKVPIPKNVRYANLSFSIGIRDGANMTPENNVVRFKIYVDDRLEFDETFRGFYWQPRRLYVDVPPGDECEIKFVTNAMGEDRGNWAVWGEPVLEAVN